MNKVLDSMQIHTTIRPRGLISDGINGLVVVLPRSAFNKPRPRLDLLKREDHSIDQ